MRSAALCVEREPSVVGIDQFDVVGLVGEDRNAPRAAFPGGYDLFLVGAELGDAGLFAVVFSQAVSASPPSSGSSSLRYNDFICFIVV